MTRTRAPSTRTLQAGFFVLLMVCTLQLAYWVIDEVRYTRSVTQRLIDHYAADSVSASVLLRRGLPAPDVRALYPQLHIGDDGAVGVAGTVVTELLRQRHQRLNRYMWEGAFFFSVLVAAMLVVLRALREEAALRRQHEQFLAAVSHEFKSPLASLRLSVDTFTMRDPGLTQRAELVRRIEVDLERLERMVYNTLDASRLAAGASTRRSEVLLGDVVQEVVGSLERFREECEAELRIAVAPDCLIYTDREGVVTVVRNLVHNALKASPRAGIVRVCGRRDGQRVVLTVADAGVGFPPTDAARLFEKFYRVEGHGRGRLQGTGLGLYLVERAVRAAGGRVTAVSAGEGHGATFTVWWPAARGRR